MFPIAQINSHGLMQRSLVGANATDPVVPERPKRQRRRRRAATQPRTTSTGAGRIAPWAIAPSETSPQGEASPLRLRGTS